MPYPSSSRGTAPVRLIVVHTAEGARTAADLAAYFSRAGSESSSHVGIDANATQQYVPYDRTAWTVRSGNAVSDNAELCAFARWTREQWLSTGVVDGCVNPRGILDRTAVWIRSRCLARNIPIRKLTASDVAAGKAGVIGHVDWTIGMRDGTHTDPGSSFPWDYVINKASSTGDWIDTVNLQEFQNAVAAGTETALRNIFYGVRYSDDRNLADEEVDQTATMRGILSEQTASNDEVVKGLKDVGDKLDKLITLLTPPAKP